MSVKHFGFIGFGLIGGSIARALKAFIKEMVDKGYNGGKVVISHAHNEADALEIKKLIKLWVIKS